MQEVGETVRSTERKTQNMLRIGKRLNFMPLMYQLTLSDMQKWRFFDSVYKGKYLYKFKLRNFEKMHSNYKHVSIQ